MDNRKEFWYTIAVMALFAIMILMAGCSHNPAVFAFGKVAKIGNVEYGEISYINGVYILDVSRENSSWEVEVDDQDGIQYDAKTSAVKGIKRIRRTIGRQVTGYLVDLAKVDKEAATEYLKAEKKEDKKDGQE